MGSCLFDRVRLAAYAVHLPEQLFDASSFEARLAPIYDRLGLPRGTLTRLSGVQSRYHWPVEFRPSDGAVAAAELALRSSAFDRKEIGALINCSVTRDCFEPATACLVHNRLGLSANCMPMDVSNACVGFSTGILLLSHLIEAGTVRAGLLVSCEATTAITEATFRRLENDTSLKREEFLELLPSLTLGSGAVAFVLCDERLAPQGHQVVGAAFHAATELSDLCVGDADYCFASPSLEPIMRTDSTSLMRSVGPLALRMKDEALARFGWENSDVGRIFAHQVGRFANRSLFESIGLPEEKYYKIYQRFGNQVSAALPISLVLAAQEGRMTTGDHLLLMGFGSGLNVVATGIRW